MKLLGNEDLERSGVVANCRMNRELRLTGSNGYERELRFNPIDYLRPIAAASGKAKWLDLCCGSGIALAEAAAIIEAENVQIKIVGIDLVGPFACDESACKCLRFVEASLTDWEPENGFDLITCVHGLHYIGDKLGLIVRVASWLTQHGRLVANLDINNIRLRNRHSATRIVAAELRRNGLTYWSRRRLIQCDGTRKCSFPFVYLGADDQAGPNYTGQAAVDSYYEKAT